MIAPEDRLRPAPSVRMAGPELNLDLNAVLSRLRGEASPWRDGHRQETVLHRETLRLVLFAFEAGGRLESHSAQGVVTIQVIRGAMRVTTAGAAYDLAPLQLLVLDPDVVHAIEARTQADMLLGVTLEKASDAPSPLHDGR